MPRIVRTARGDQVDFDAIVIKQKLAQAPMAIEVERRKQLIDAKQTRKKIDIVEPTIEEPEEEITDEFEIEAVPKTKRTKKVQPPEINLPDRS